MKDIWLMAVVTGWLGVWRANTGDVKFGKFQIKQHVSQMDVEIMKSDMSYRGEFQKYYL